MNPLDGQRKEGVVWSQNKNSNCNCQDGEKKGGVNLMKTRWEARRPFGQVCSNNNSNANRKITVFLNRGQLK